MVEVLAADVKKRPVEKAKSLPKVNPESEFDYHRWFLRLNAGNSIDQETRDAVVDRGFAQWMSQKHG